MTFLGRILVFVHLFLSICFMAFAGAVYTAHTNWKAKTDSALKAAAAAQSKADTELKAMQTQVDLEKQKYAQLENLKTTFEGEAKTLKDENARLEADNKQVKIAADTHRVNAELATQEALERKEEAKVQRARNAELNDNRNKLVTELNTERDKTFALDLKLTEVSQKYDKLLRDNAIMKAYLASKDLPTDVKVMTVSSSPPPPLDGVVLEARREQKGNRTYVEISVGGDDGLVNGHTLTVFKGTKYKGKIRLEDVRYKTAVGVVVETAPNSKIEKDDHVTTKL
jgi:hypothetical protein